MTTARSRCRTNHRLRCEAEVQINSYARDFYQCELTATLIRDGRRA
jgi:hypothetical protein